MPKYCYTHMEDGMVDVANKSCKAEGCTTTASADHEMYCAHCFNKLFPEKKISKTQRFKETCVANFVSDTFSMFNVVCDKRIQGADTKIRPDILIECNTHNVVVEVDEHKHYSYDKDKDADRMAKLFEYLGKKPLVMIRFNPDRYHVPKQGYVQSCFGKKNGIIEDTLSNGLLA
jgi:hypothetical protein